MSNGKNQKREIPFGKPQIGEEEIQEVIGVLKSGWLTHGPKTKEFEQKFAEYCGSEYAVAVGSCTAALHLSLKALGVTKGDEVIVPTQTHVATSHAVIYTGATPVFADVEPETYNISIESIESKITKKTKGIMPVHFAGQPCRMDEIKQIADEHDLFIVEDAAHALGAKYKGKSVGSLGTESACFSFYPVKHITTGEGGMLATDNKEIAEKAMSTRAFGITRSTWERTTVYRPWYYEVEDIGFNYRMTEIGSTLGVCQLRKNDKFNEMRTKNARALEKGLGGLKGVELPETIDDVKHVYLFYQILVNKDAKVKRDELIPMLKELGVGTSVHYPVPVHLMPVYKKLFGYKEGSLPDAEKVSKEAISLPVHAGISGDDLEYMVTSIRSLLD